MFFIPCDHWNKIAGFYFSFSDSSLRDNCKASKKKSNEKTSKGSDYDGLIPLKVSLLVRSLHILLKAFSYVIRRNFDTFLWLAYEYLSIVLFELNDQGSTYLFEALS